ncbi:glycosyltransferase [Microbacterium sp. NPDC055683]
MPAEPRIAIAHDYLTQRGGAERVVLSMARAFPGAPIYTTLYDPAGTFPEFRELDVRVSPLNRIGRLRRDHRSALLALPFAASRLRVPADVVLASSSGWAHGFPTTGRKIVYCYSPARWLYQTDAYLGDSGTLKRAVLSLAGGALRTWDRRAAATADRYLAISTVVQGRIRDAYARDARIVPAPHSTDVAGALEPVDGIEPGAYLCVSRLLPYKNVDRVIEAFARMPDRRLVVVGRGPEEARLRALATGNVRMVKDLSDAQLRWLYAVSRGVVAASYEDFGLTPIEAAAFGRPSAVLRWGGFLDTVREGETGVYFDEPEPGLIVRAIDELEERDWDEGAILATGERFSEARFADELRRVVAEVTAT